MSGQAKFFTGSCSIDDGKEYEYIHGTYVQVDPRRIALPKDYVDLRAAMHFSENCFQYDSDVGRRVWWVLLYDEVHHKLLQLDSQFTGHQLEFDIRHIATGLPRLIYVDQGGDPQDLLDPWQWMMSRYLIQVESPQLRDSGIAKYSDAEQQFLFTWSCIM